MNISFHLQHKLYPLRCTNRLLQFSRNMMQKYHDKHSKPIANDANIEIYHYLKCRTLEAKTNWKEIREDLLNQSKNITSVNIDAMTLHYCISHKYFNAAFDYINHLKEENIKLNLATLGKYFRLFYELHCEGNLTQEQKQFIWSTYKDLQKLHKVLDPNTNENVIYALSVTENWRECLTLLENTKIIAMPTAAAYSVTIAAAFYNGDYLLGWQLLDEMLINNRLPYDVVRHSYLNSCNKLSSMEKEAKLLDFFKTLNALGLKCNLSDIDLLKSTFKSINYELRDTNINRSGVCKCCNKRLDESKLTEAEFKELKERFLEKVIIGKNIFYKTTPTELEHFKRFTSNMNKYDVVIDGLNVAYSAGTKQSPKVFAFLVLSVIKHFTKLNQKVLIIGRKHMIRWHLWSDIRRSAATFVTDNISQDDPYLLYCALLSGNDTLLISRDMMRSHLHVLKDYNHRRLFQRWLSQNKHEVLHVDTNGKVFLKYPLSYNVSNQKHEDTWHIPYEDISTNEKLIKWLCVRKCR